MSVLKFTFPLDIDAVTISEPLYGSSRIESIDNMCCCIELNYKCVECVWNCNCNTVGTMYLDFRRFRTAKGFVKISKNLFEEYLTEFEIENPDWNKVNVDSVDMLYEKVEQAFELFYKFLCQKVGAENNFVDIRRSAYKETKLEQLFGNICEDRCHICGTDELNFVKEPSNEPDCHISYCGACNGIICETCCKIGPHLSFPNENDIFCPDCEAGSDGEEEAGSDGEEEADPLRVLGRAGFLPSPAGANGI